MLPTYNIVTSIAKGKLTHVILNRVDPVSLKILEEKVKLKVGTDLKDESNNHFKVNGYFGEYMILRSEHLGSHPIGKYLTKK